MQMRAACHVIFSSDAASGRSRLLPWSRTFAGPDIAARPSGARTSGWHAGSNRHTGSGNGLRSSAAEIAW
jgi:hypothetical protein